MKQIGIILILGAFLFALQLFAFTEPSSSPPGSNVSAPLNVGSAGQSKAGGLILNTGGAAYGLIIQSGFVGIGTVNPTQALDVMGNVKFSGALMPNANAGLAGQVLTSQGPGNPPKWVGSQQFTASGTFTVPTGVTSISVDMSGGGGSGGYGGDGSGQNGGGGGGGAGAVSAIQLSVTPGASYAITVGAGASWSGGNGSAGGSTNFGSLLSVGGGGGGFQATAGGAGGSAGGPGGSPGISAVSGSSTGGAGGNSLFGTGGFGGPRTSVAGNGTGYGSGGGGGGGNGWSPGAGAPGFVRVTW